MDTWSRKYRGATNIHENDLAYVTDDKTEHLPTWLPLVEHQPVIITANIATELGLVNGTMAHMSSNTLTIMSTWLQLAHVT